MIKLLKNELKTLISKLLVKVTMFCYFRKFTNLINLSSNIFHRLKHSLYSDNISKLILKRKDIDSFEQIYESIEDVVSFVFKLENYNISSKNGVRWMKCIFTIFKNNPLIEISNESSLFYQMCECGTLDMVKYFYRNRLQNIDHLIRVGPTETVKWILDHNNEYIDDYNQLLVESSTVGRLDLVKYFIEEKNADIHYLCDLPLRQASWRGHLNILQYLFSKGVDIHAHENIALRDAIAGGHPEIVKYLINVGVDKSCLINILYGYCSNDFIEYIISKSEEDYDN